MGKICQLQGSDSDIYLLSRVLCVLCVHGSCGWHRKKYWQLQNFSNRFRKRCLSVSVLYSSSVSRWFLLEFTSSIISFLVTLPFPLAVSLQRLPRPARVQASHVLHHQDSDTLQDSPCQAQAAVTSHRGSWLSLHLLFCKFARLEIERSTVQRVFAHYLWTCCSFFFIYECHKHGCCCCKDIFHEPAFLNRNASGKKLSAFAARRKSAFGGRWKNRPPVGKLNESTRQGFFFGTMWNVVHQQFMISSSQLHLWLYCPVLLVL